MNTDIFKNIIFSLGISAMASAITSAGAILDLTRFEWVWPVAVMSAVVGFVGHYIKSTINQTLQNRTYTLRNRVEQIRRDIGDIHGMVRLSPYMEQLPLPFGGGWALTGDSAALLARYVIVRQPETILELGSGVSTLIVGKSWPAMAVAA